MIWLFPAFIAAAVLILMLIRPAYLHRGLSTEEWQAVWFGDEFLPLAKPSGSRAILIAAAPEVVWGWVTQIGQDRAGFYSYRWLENLAGARMPDVREQRTEWSTREVGQKLMMAPVERFGPIAAMDIVAVDPGRAMVAVNQEGTWAFVVQPMKDGTSRLVARGTWMPSQSALARFFRALVFDPIHYVMEWRMLRGIKNLSEANRSVSSHHGVVA